MKEESNFACSFSFCSGKQDIPHRQHCFKEAWLHHQFIHPEKAIKKPSRAPNFG